MNADNFLSQLQVADFYVRPYDDAQAQRALADLETAALHADVLHVQLNDLTPLRRLIAAAAGNAPYLARMIPRSVSVLEALCRETAEQVFDKRLEALANEMKSATQTDQAMSALRRAKSDIALIVALADIASVWPLATVTHSLSRFADTALRESIRFLLRQAAEQGKITLADAEQPERDTGLIIIAMGKYGAYELNYSSDIDLIIFFERQKVSLCGDITAQEVFVKLAKDLVAFMQTDTADGYVFRTDLRLRPDPGSTAIAISTEAAEQYYESMGQNWERAAFIKARACAGDLEAGESFLKNLTSFMWRKYLDFAAIEDIHAMKRQIHAFHGISGLSLLGANIKLGRGGIREIEFFCQTQQLIAGGRDPDLRVRGTSEGLDRLAEKKWITPEAAASMKEAYVFLRTLEHRLQMFNDEQTQTLPRERAGLEWLSCFMGFASVEQFEKRLMKILERVQGHYGALFESSPPLSEDSGNLVFTGGEDDPETVNTLQKLGFKNPSAAIATIRAWHVGRIRATRSARAKEMLTALMPFLLTAIGGTSQPDVTLTRFDRFLSGLPAGVQLFSLLYTKPSLLDLLANILGTAPGLANFLSQQPRVLDAVLTPGFFDGLSAHDERAKSLDDALSRRRDFQDTLDICRQWAREERFRIGVHVLTGLARATDAGTAYADIAGILISRLQPLVEEELALAHGHVPGGEMIVIGMGKLGGYEMAANSDLDLIFVYDFSEKPGQSSGPRVLPGGQYFARFSQRLINALTVPTAEGGLYEVDMRLRPSGNSGPIATQADRFEQYHASESWTWEKMALLRARILSGAPSLASRIEKVIHESLCYRRDPAMTANDVMEMRLKLAREFSTDDPWQIKHVRGGLIDLEFICQFLQLVYAHDHPEILDTRTQRAFENLGRAGCIPMETAQELKHAGDFLLTLTQILRSAHEGDFKPDEATEALRALVARAGGAASFGELERMLLHTQARVKFHFEDLVGKATGA